MGVIIGVDPHKASCTAAVLDERGELVAQQRFASTADGLACATPLGQALARAALGR